MMSKYTYFRGISTFALALTFVRATSSCNWGIVAGSFIADGDCIIAASPYNESGNGDARSWRTFCNYTNDSVQYGQAYAEFYEGTDSCEKEKLDYVEKLNYYQCCQTCEYVSGCESYEMNAYIYNKYNTSDCSDDDAIGYYFESFLYPELYGCYEYGRLRSMRYEFEEDELMFKWAKFDQSDCNGTPTQNYTFRDGCYYMPLYEAYVMTSINSFKSGVSLLMRCNGYVEAMSLLIALIVGFSLCN